MFQIGPREIGADLAFGVDLALFILQCSCNKIMSSCNCPIQSNIDVPAICRATGETTLESRGYFFVSSYREKKAFEFARRVRIAKILQKMLLVLVARLWWILKSSLCKSWG